MPTEMGCSIGIKASKNDVVAIDYLLSTNVHRPGRVCGHGPPAKHQAARAGASGYCPIG
jgi:hypothetical protein